MRLSINRTNLKQPIRFIGLDEKLVLGRRYDLPDAQGYSVIFHEAGRDTIVVCFKSGKKTVRTETIELLSSITGKDSKGNPVSSPLLLELDPTSDAPIFPINDLVKRLMEMSVDDEDDEVKIQRWQITPLSDDEIRVLSASYTDPRMISDGEVNPFTQPARSGLLAARGYTVRTASWAIRFYGSTIDHIYLWMTAADKIDEILQAIADIKAGKYELDED